MPKFANKIKHFQVLPRDKWYGHCLEKFPFEKTQMERKFLV